MVRLPKLVPLVGVPVVALVLVAGGLGPSALQAAGGPDGPGGTPRPGADPANQPPPSSLTVNAERAEPSDVDDPGVNTGKTKPARGLRGSRTLVDPGRVLEESTPRGGCTEGYGGGAACLPVVPPSAAGHGHHGGHRWTCAEARRTLPQGILVTGDDQLGLDSNDDGTACGPGDR